MDNVANSSFLACFKLTKAWNSVDNVYQTLSNEFLKGDNVDNVAKTSFLACFKLTGSGTMWTMFTKHFLMNF